MTTYYNQKKNIHGKGFTLVELMVSLTIFSIVMLISTGTLLIMIDINAKAQAVYATNSNLAFALDDMTREIRTGYHYYCTETTQGQTEALPTPIDKTRDCDGWINNFGTFISFTRGWDNWQVGYRLANGRIEQRVYDPAGVGSTGWLPITADDITITNFHLEAQNTTTYLNGLSDVKQPYVDMTIDGETRNGLDTPTQFHIQTHIVQRLLDRQ